LRFRAASRLVTAATFSGSPPARLAAWARWPRRSWCWRKSTAPGCSWSS